MMEFARWSITKESQAAKMLSTLEQAIRQISTSTRCSSIRGCKRIDQILEQFKRPGIERREARANGKFDPN